MDCFTGSDAVVCPSHCNTTGDYIDAMDCTEWGYCCGRPDDIRCCVHYHEHLYDLVNATQDECTVKKEQIERERSGAKHLNSPTLVSL